MRFSKLIIIGILLIVAGVVLIYHDQAGSKTRACKRRVRKAWTAVCTWTVVGEKKVWNLAFEEDGGEGEELFTQFREAMLADLDAPREEGTSEAIPEYQITLTNRKGLYPFDFEINIGNTTWIECGGGTYPNLGHTLKFLRSHEKSFEAPPEK